MKTKRHSVTALIIALLAIPGMEATAAPVYNSGNGHYYEVYDDALDWSSAAAAASGLNYSGVSGHLVTITSAQENTFLTSTFGESVIHFHWTGGYQQVGSTEPDGGWAWITGETFSFSNWEPGEPNNTGGTEDRIIFDHGVGANGKSWNDLEGITTAAGYVVEFDTAPVPEPGSVVLLGSGLLLLPFYRRRHNRKTM